VSFVFLEIPLSIFVNFLSHSKILFILAKKTKMATNKIINIEESPIAIIDYNNEDYISLTDMARSQMQEAVIIKWLSLKSTIEYLGEWEALYNPIFNYTEFGTIKNTAGSNNFVLSVKQWIEQTGAIGLTAKAGRYGGTYAHKDIAFHFGMWISPKFQLLLVKEYQRLKEDENERLKLTWNLQRTLAKVNYKIHTDAIKENLIPQTLPKDKINFVYADEADMLNMALFGMTAKQWRDANPKTIGNIRDEATIEQLVVLSNIESINAVLIHQGLPQHNRLQQLNSIAISQMKSLTANTIIKKLL
jgi:KilA-N domain